MKALQLFLGLALVCCGAAASDFLTPTWEATVEACYRRQLRAVEEAESREQAELEVARIRSKCDKAYEGIRAAGELLEVGLERDEDE